ncbi:manganese ion homeostasis (Fr), putative [Talaromyces stipitatus ATCC 10500]|uniref:Manganese ion homeostasis (Fr), putative n=1 Tax=Talaromyces stipitatus (strain ATCC 10500 / CBS 375.48 / QM 6759 / NRRL 1006) TaxID=441959 RepID=B8MQC4_TALSN|nr:manganese ion homeostasis (Fr), putative [Talaromyces stipitatus ATCC 10500]EED13326.1 manganese ion homeostasis (Fr), putative [Talaromyces stipitatus ATCC 10500]
MSVDSSYGISHGSPGLRYSQPNQYVEPRGLVARARNAAYTYVQDSKNQAGTGFRYGRNPGLSWQKAKSLLRGSFCVANFLAALWMFTLWWGERTVFREQVSQCYWDSWEKWPANATPHHVVFIADPQLVDPHTYPGRPWPLSTLTVQFTDQYLRRSFSLIEDYLHPDSVLFLGDLFDGGREWSTSTSQSPEERYRKYGEGFWLKEYNRFTRIFFNQWNKNGLPATGERRGRKLIASLPGNHDLGFGSGVQLAVRRRFQGYFGRGNRVDVIGNHTFVSVDSVSLSAMEQPDETGSSGIGAGDGHQPNQAIWGPTEQWLKGVKDMKARLETEELRSIRNQTEGFKLVQGLQEASADTVAHRTPIESQGLPTILLTHVPLFREPATPCGPLREHYPPSTTDPMPEEDEANALKIAGGYQYQNVLTPAISNEIMSRIGPGVSHIYSGDDHDYCEVTHREYTGSPKEITVKSLSWAMGVRHPGFLMTTLWNPIDPSNGKPLAETSQPTIRNHLCLLPDQLSIFVHYGIIFFVTIVILTIRAMAITFLSFGKPTNYEPDLPISELQAHSRTSSRTSSPPYTSVTSATSGGEPRLANRNNSTLTDPTYRIDEEVQKSTQRYEDWKKPHGGSDWDDDDRGTAKLLSYSRQSGRECVGPASSIGRFAIELKNSVKQVAIIVLPFYFWLLWNW